jgi:hypothetical protein
VGGAVEDGGNEATLDGVDSQPESFERVDAQYFEVVWPAEQAHRVKGAAFECDQDLGRSSLGGSSLDGEDAPTLRGLEAEITQPARRDPGVHRAAVDQQRDGFAPVGPGR